jgi:hypothetical protein
MILGERTPGIGGEGMKENGWEGNSCMIYLIHSM